MKNQISGWVIYSQIQNTWRDCKLRKSICGLRTSEDVESAHGGEGIGACGVEQVDLKILVANAIHLTVEVLYRRRI